MALLLIDAWIEDESRGVAAQLNFPSSAQINFRYLERRIVPSFQIVASDFDAQ
jgi:hypothetical protein